MKIANPDRTLGEVMAEQGKRPYGWYEMETLLGVVQGFYPDVVRIDLLSPVSTQRLRSELSRAEVHPWRYALSRLSDGMVTVRAMRQESRVTETEPARLGSRAWEADPAGYFDAGHGHLVLADSEHDPRLGPDYGEDDRS